MTDLPSKVKVFDVVYSVEYLDKPSEVDLFKRESLWGSMRLLDSLYPYLQKRPDARRYYANVMARSFTRHNYVFTH